MFLLIFHVHTASEDPPRPPLDSARSFEMSGYMPCRGDFEVVWHFAFSFEGVIGAYQKPENQPKFPSKPKNRKKNRSKPKNCPSIMIKTANS